MSGVINAVIATKIIQLLQSQVLTVLSDLQYCCAVVLDTGLRYLRWKALASICDVNAAYPMDHRRGLHYSIHCC